ncbi:hypothetical protein VM98_34805 [Streptomyces rubellomurinus subsp. indigoferus]|nr:hypothetical protein VM98_34805 [Streptomyces rubellomurinus subsp. indigoferus]
MEIGDSVGELARARLGPDGQLRVILKAREEGAIRADVGELRQRLESIERLFAQVVADRRPPH